MVGAIVFLVVGEACPVAISLSAGCAAIIHEGSIDVLDSGGAIHFERLGFGLWGRTVWYARAVVWLHPLVWCMWCGQSGIGW